MQRRYANKRWRPGGKVKHIGSLPTGRRFRTKRKVVVVVDQGWQICFFQRVNLLYN